MSFKWIFAIWITVLAHISFPATSSSNSNAGENYFKAGKKHLDARNDDSAFRAFKRAAYAGHIGGMRLLALCYIEGIGCWVDQDEGAYWFECAANHGDGFSALELAKIHFRKRRSVKGIDMLQKAAETFAQQEDQQGLIDCAQLAMDVGAKELAVAIYEISSGSSYTPTPPTLRGGTGTAWFVNETDVVTCNHVIEGCNTFSLIDNNGKKSKLSLIATDERNDLAVLRISSSEKLPPESVLTIKIYSELSVRKGGTCFTLGFPQPGIQGSSCKYTEGKINALEGVQGTKSHYQISAEIHPGNSGGPLFNAEGDVIGVIVSKLKDSQNVNYAIKGKILLDFLREHNITYTKSTKTQTPTNIEDLVEIKEKAVFLIEATPSN